MTIQQLFTEMDVLPVIRELYHGFIVANLLFIVAAVGVIIYIRRRLREK